MGVDRRTLMVAIFINAPPICCQCYLLPVIASVQKVIMQWG